MRAEPLEQGDSRGRDGLAARRDAKYGSIAQKFEHGGDWRRQDPMIKFTLEALKKLDFQDDQIFTTLEKRMKCGIGICGRCNIGSSYVCVDGPVYSYAQLKALPNEL